MSVIKEMSGLRLSLVKDEIGEPAYLLSDGAEFRLYAESRSRLLWWFTEISEAEYPEWQAFCIPLPENPEDHIQWACRNVLAKRGMK